MKQYTHYKDRPKYQIEMIDVGNGDCFIIQYYYSQDQYYLFLVDSGFKENGEKILKHLNTYYPGHQIDWAIITHEDGDHYGGLSHLLEQLEEENPKAVPVKAIIANGLKYGLYSYGDIKKSVDKLKSKKVHIEVYNSFDKIDSLPDCFTFLSPSKKLFESLYVTSIREEAFSSILESLDEKKSTIKSIDDYPDDNSSSNSMSIVFLFEPEGPDKVKFLFTGDATRETLTKVMNNHPATISNCTWLKVPHHGSVRNLTTNLIATINPKQADISTNKPKDAKDIINALKSNGTKVFSTHLHGSILRRVNTEPRENWTPIDPL